jgi:hypothetical protein
MSNFNDSSSNRFSLVELKKIHQQLVENKSVRDGNEHLVIEILRIIAEMVVYGDNKSELLFDFFCEKNMLSIFLEIMWTETGCPLPVHIQILQTLSILISSVKNDTSLYYLLSNNYINDIIIFPHDFSAEGSDESLLAQYASFIKTLSLRLNEQTVQFFFIEETGAFPLLTKSIELLSINDPMVRISAQTAILNVYHVNDERSRAYALQEEVLVVLFDTINRLMTNQLTSLQNLLVKNQQLSSNSSSSYQPYNCSSDSSNDHNSDHGGVAGFEARICGELTKIDQSVEDLTISIEDWLYYLQDVFDLNIEILQRSLVCNILNNFVLPFMISPLLKLVKSGEFMLYCCICIFPLFITCP